MIMIRIFFILGLWLAGLISDQQVRNERCSIVKSGTFRLIPDKDSILIHAGPVNHAASKHFPSVGNDPSGD